jgi:hypothetical protein
VLEGPCHVRDLSRYVQAVASLLEARNSQRATPVADAELLHLAVWGRILAGNARTRKDAVEALHRRWLVFLGDRNLQVLEFLAAGAGSSEEIIKRVENWLGLLDEELAAEPPSRAEEDSRFKLFVRLAWWRWVAGGDSIGWWAVCANLRVAPVRGKVRASVSWLRQRMEERVPRQRWDEALGLLPQAELSFKERMLGGR